MTNGTVGLAATRKTYTTALGKDLQQEPTPYLYKTAISKGTVQTTLGGKVDFKDSSGGTSIFTYNPDTGSVTFGGPLVLNGSVTFGSIVTFNNRSQIEESSMVFFSNTGTPGFISLQNPSGNEVVRLEAGTGGFGTIRTNEIDFVSNTSNKFTENFGIVANLADVGGFHSFWVKNRNGDNLWQFASNGQLKQLKAGDWQMQGPSNDPGAGPTNSVKFYITNNGGGKDVLALRFTTGTVGIGTAP